MKFTSAQENNCRSAPLLYSRIVALIVLGIVCSGCVLSGTTAPEITESSQLVTNSISEVTKPDGIEEADAELIKSTVVAAPVHNPGKPLAWSNPETGTSGAIVAIDKFRGKHGQNCRGFRTTVANFMGIAYYNGETCQLNDEKWVLSWFKAAN